MGEDWLEGELYSKLIAEDSSYLMWLEVAAMLGRIDIVASKDWPAFVFTGSAALGGKCLTSKVEGSNWNNQSVGIESRLDGQGRTGIQ